MERPCVAVARESGEATRQRLAEADLIDREFGIEVVDGELYIPVTEPESVPAELQVTQRDVPARTPQRTPADLLGYEPTYERLGDVVLVDEDDPDRAAAIAAAIVESDIPVRSVLNRDSKVKGETRVRDWEVLADEDIDREKVPERDIDVDF